MKIKIKNLIILLIGSLTFLAFMNDWMLALFFNGTFTCLGIFINLILGGISCLCFDYLEEKNTSNCNC